MEYESLATFLKWIACTTMLVLPQIYIFTICITWLCVIVFKYLHFRVHTKCHKWPFHIYPPERASSKGSMFTDQKQHLSVDKRSKCEEKHTFSGLIWIDVDVALVLVKRPNIGVVWYTTLGFETELISSSLFYTCVYVCDFQSRAHSIQRSLPPHTSELQKGLFPEQKHAPYNNIQSFWPWLNSRSFPDLINSSGGKGW